MATPWVGLGLFCLICFVSPSLPQVWHLVAAKSVNFFLILDTTSKDSWHPKCYRQQGGDGSGAIFLLKMEMCIGAEDGFSVEMLLTLGSLGRNF